VPARVVASLLAVPPDDLDFFVDRSAVLIDRSYSPQEVARAREDLDGYLGTLAQHRLEHPGDDLVSRLVTTHVATGSLPMADAVPMIRLLLVAGHGTTASQASLTLLSLLTDADLRRRCAGDPDAVPRAVDELLRYHSIVQNGLARAATRDVAVGDVVIRAGEGVVISLSAANRDPAVFPDPDRLDPDRDARRHVAFGHGVHQCLGQWLAKLELEEVVGAFLRWMPGARLAVPVEAIRFRPEVSSYGVDELPVTW
jgi:cytochrome P450